MPQFESALQPAGHRFESDSAHDTPTTIKSYVEAVRFFREYQVGFGMPTELDRITRVHVESFIADQLERLTAKTAEVRRGDPPQLFRWAVEDGEIRQSPMATMSPPVAP
jgi:site-specific recombinase XerD